MFWSLIEQFGSQGIHLGVFLFLTFCLQPSDFGIVSMAGSWLAIEAIFSELGFGAAIIQRKAVEDVHLSTVFLVNVFTGIVLTAISVALSWPCAHFFKTPEVQPVMAILSFGFLIDALALTQRAILRRTMRFKILAIRSIISLFVAGTTALILAINHYGVWSLVAFALVNSFIGTLLFWKLSSWRPSIRSFSFNALNELWPYSSKILLNSVFKSLFHNSDKLLIGFFLGPVSLGVYEFTNKIILQPANKLSLAVGNFLFPFYSRLQDDLLSIKNNYCFINKSINSIIVPLLIGFAFMLPYLIAAWYGDKWSAAIPIVKLMALASIGYTFIWPIGVLMKALNRPGWFLAWSIAFTSAVATAIFVLGKTGELTTVMYGITAAYLIMTFVSFRISGILTKTSLKEFFRTLLISSIGNIFLLVILFSAERWIAFSRSWWATGVLLFILYVTYFLFLRRFDPIFIERVSQKITGRFLKKRK